MRFEIGPGGMLVILLGLAGLSGAVFGLGLVAGHELSGSEPGSQSVVAAYPLPPTAPGSSVPAEASAPPVNPGSAAASASTITGLGSTGAGSAGFNDAAVNPPAPPAGDTAALKAPVPAASALRKSATSKNAVALRRSRTSAAATASDEDLSTGTAVAPPPEPGSASAEPEGTDEEEPESAPAAPPAPVHRRLAAVNPPAPRAASGPYSVQIDAMMDFRGAQEMARKIKAKGFQPFVVQTQVDGKTWYRLRVGHYATPEDAQAAESRLHQEFNQNPPGN